MTITSMSSAAPAGAVQGALGSDVNFPDPFQRSAAILADRSGQYTQAQKLAAYQYIAANWTSLRNSSPADKIAVDSALSDLASLQSPTPAVDVTLSDDAKALLAPRQST